MNAIVPHTPFEPSDEWMDALDALPSLKSLYESSPQKARVVEAFAKSPSLSLAAEQCGIPPSVAYAWSIGDEIFQQALIEVRPLYADHMRGVVYQRAVLGIDKPVIYRGFRMYERDGDGMLILDENFEKIPLVEKVYSDKLLERLADAAIPELRNSRSPSTAVNVTAPGVDAAQPGSPGDQGVVVEVNFVDAPDNWDDVEWDEETGRPILAIEDAQVVESQE